LRNDPDLIINKKDFPEERQIAKTISFKVAYGGSAYTLKDDFGTSEEEAQLFIDNFLNAFPDLKSYFKNCEENVLKTGYIIIDKTTNRRWFSPDFDKLEKINKEIWSYFPDNYRKLSKEQREKVKKEVYLKNPHVKDMWSLYFTIQSSLKRTSLNYPIQGLAGSQTKKSAVLFRKYCIENNLQDKLFLVNLIHDECSAEVNENFAEKGLQILKSKMIEGAQFFCEKVKMDAEGNINTNWSK
jgi:DNA polymerase I-like protein with 3'-5' exonuclease and polymerase domains